MLSVDDIVLSDETCDGVNAKLEAWRQIWSLRVRLAGCIKIVQNMVI